MDFKHKTDLQKETHNLSHSGETKIKEKSPRKFLKNFPLVVML